MLAPTGLRTSDLREPAPLFDDVVSMGLLPASRERQITVEEARAGTEGWLKGRSCCSRRPSAVVCGEGERERVTVRVCGPAVLDQAPASQMTLGGMQGELRAWCVAASVSCCTG